MKEKLFYSVTYGLYMISIIVLTQLIIFNKVDLASLIGAIIGISVAIPLVLENNKYKKDRYNIFTKEYLIQFSLLIIAFILIRFFVSPDYRIYPMLVIVVILITYEIIKRRRKRSSRIELQVFKTLDKLYFFMIFYNQIKVTCCNTLPLQARLSDGDCI
ncbi:hypothetical protein ACM3BK_02795 [Mammaliicoccus sciuri]